MLLELLGLVLSLTVYLAIAIPLNGALVRLRANFNPKAIQLDAEGNVEPHTGPIVTSFFGMLKHHCKQLPQLFINLFHYM